MGLKVPKGEKMVAARMRSKFALVLLLLWLWGPLSPPEMVARSQQTAQPASPPLYETRQIHDPDGSGKFYMGREIAQVMGPGGISWLNRPGRAEEEKSDLIIQALDLRGGETVADIGAGSGYYTFKIAPIVGTSGRVLAVDIQDEMIATLRRGTSEHKAANVEIIKGSEQDPHLPANSVDLALMVDVYHELAYPYEEMIAIRKALKPGGRMAFVEYKKEDPSVAIKQVHKMSVEQLKKEMAAVHLTHVKTVESLPLQHIVIFAKPD